MPSTCSLSIPITSCALLAPLPCLVSTKTWVIWAVRIDVADSRLYRGNDVRTHTRCIVNPLIEDELIPICLLCRSAHHVLESLHDLFVMKTRQQRAVQLWACGGQGDTVGYPGALLGHRGFLGVARDNTMVEPVTPPLRPFWRHERLSYRTAEIRGIFSGGHRLTVPTICWSHRWPTSWFIDSPVFEWASVGTVLSMINGESGGPRWTWQV